MAFVLALGDNNRKYSTPFKKSAYSCYLQHFLLGEDSLAQIIFPSLGGALRTPEKELGCMSARIEASAQGLSTLTPQHQVVL